MSTSILKALPGKLDIKRQSPSILYISASLTMSTSILKALPGKLDIKRQSPSILYISASLTMSTSILKALPGKLDIKRHSPSILYISASLAMSTSILKALPGKLDIKRHSPRILYISASFTMSTSVLKALISKDTHLVVSLYVRSKNANIATHIKGRLLKRAAIFINFHNYDFSFVLFVLKRTSIDIHKKAFSPFINTYLIEPVHEISNNVAF